MDKLQAENEKRLLQHEKEAFKQLKTSYTNALADIKARVKILQSSIDDLEIVDTSNYTKEQLEIHKSKIQSKVYQLEYQKTLSKQVGSIVDVLKQDTVQNVQSYLNTMYKDSYLGMQYYINKRGIPITTPMNPSEVVNVINKKIEDMTFADRINANMNDFKKTIRAEISRGLASGSSYKQIAENLSMVTGEDMYKSERIVRTEGARVSSTAKLTSIRDMKEKGADLVKVWDSTLDGRTRWEHGMLDGQTAEVDEPFKAGGYEVMAPGMFGIPSQDCNCRCVVLSVPRWDVDDTVVKYDNEHDELVEVKNYEDWKQGYYVKIAEQETKELNKIKTFDEMMNSIKSSAQEWIKKYDVDGKSAPLIEIKKQLTGKDNVFDLLDDHSEVRLLHEIDGYNAKPRIVSEQYLKNNNINNIVYRGVEDYKDISASSMLEQFKNGELYAGGGLFGNGTYTTDSLAEALDVYANGVKKNVLKMGIANDARIIKYDDLVAIKEKVSALPETNTEEFLTKQLLLNEGNLAEALGYDVIEIDRIAERMEQWHRRSTVLDNNTKYYIVLNRGKVYVVE